MSPLFYIFASFRCPWPVVAITAVVMLLAPASSALAEEEPADTALDLASDSPEDTSEEDDGITVRTTEREQRWRDDERFASGMTTRHPTTELSLRAETMGDALSQATGTYVRRQSSYGQPAHLSVRGGNPRQIVVDLDGLRLSAPAGTGFDVGTMMPHGVASADILRGAAAASRGGGAPTGAMQLNLAEAPDDGARLQGRLMGGSFGTAATEAEVGVGNGGGGFLLYGGVRHSDGDFPFVDHRDQTRQRLNNEHHRAGVGATGHLKNDSHTLRLSARFESGQSGSPGPSEFQNAFRRAGIDDRRALGTARWEGDDLWSRSSILVDAYATAGAHEHRMDYENEAGFMGGDPFSSRSVERTAALTAGLQAFVGDSHLLRLDAEGRASSFYGHVHTSSRADFLHARRHTLAVSASDEWLLADERISLTGSLRTELSRDGQGLHHIRPLLPALGAIGRLHRRLQLRANLARTYRQPHFDELYLETETLRGNPELDPEEALVADVGLQLGDSDDPLRVKAALFRHSMDSMILILPASAHHFEARNLQGATSRGLEASAHTELYERLAIDGAYTFTDAHLHRHGDDTAPQLPGQPRHRLHLESTLGVREHSPSSRAPGVELRSQIHYRSSINLDNFGHLRNEAALRVDAGADLVVTSDLRLSLQLQNLLDHRRAVDSLQQPLPGRALYLSMEMRGTRR